MVRQTNSARLRLAEESHGIVIENLLLLRFGDVLSLQQILRSIFSRLAVGIVGRVKELVLAEKSDFLFHQRILHLAAHEDPARLEIIPDGAARQLIRQHPRLDHSIPLEIMIHSPNHIEDPLGAEFHKPNTEIRIAIQHSLKKFMGSNLYLCTLTLPLVNRVRAEQEIGTLHDQGLQPLLLSSALTRL